MLNLATLDQVGYHSRFSNFRSSRIRWLATIFADGRFSGCYNRQGLNTFKSEQTRNMVQRLKYIDYGKRNQIVSRRGKWLALLASWLDLLLRKRPYTLFKGMTRTVRTTLPQRFFYLFQCFWNRKRLTLTAGLMRGWRVSQSEMATSDRRFSAKRIFGWFIFISI